MFLASRSFGTVLGPQTYSVQRRLLFEKKYEPDAEQKLTSGLLTKMKIALNGRSPDIKGFSA
jgi:hypothetical protein